MTRVCLIRPAEGVSPGALSSNAPTLPLGIAYLAAAVREAGHEVRVIDAVGEDITRMTERDGTHWIGMENSAIISRVEPGTDLIGIGAMFSHNWPLVRRLSAELRAAFPDTPIVIGGEHVTAMPEFCLREAPAVDLCALGEGEETLVELIEARAAGRDLTAVRGIAFRDGAEIRTNPRRDRIRAIDDIAPPAWDLFNINIYAEHNFTIGLQVQDARPALPILATRGCPYQCTFCSSPNMWTTAWTPRDPKLVVDEIERYVRDYGVTNFPFQDLTAIIRKEWIMAFCRELIDRRLNIHWQLPVGTRSEAIDRDVTPLLKASGMVYMGYAPESGSERVRKVIKKRIKIDSFYDSMRAAMDAGLQVQAFFVIGFPEEKIRDLWSTLGMVTRLSLMGVQDIAIQHYMPYPGSEMHDRLVREGIIDTGDEWLTSAIGSHGMFIPARWQVNRNFGARTQSLFLLAGFAVFYALSALRKPVFFARMIAGMFTNPRHDVSRLQRALKGIFNTKPVFKGSEGTRPEAK